MRDKHAEALDNCANGTFWRRRRGRRGAYCRFPRVNNTMIMTTMCAVFIETDKGERERRTSLFRGILRAEILRRGERVEEGSGRAAGESKPILQRQDSSGPSKFLPSTRIFFFSQPQSPSIPSSLAGPKRRGRRRGERSRNLLRFSVRGTTCSVSR